MTTVIIFAILIVVTIVLAVLMVGRYGQPQAVPDVNVSMTPDVTAAAPTVVDIPNPLVRASSQASGYTNMRARASMPSKDTFTEAPMPKYEDTAATGALYNSGVTCEKCHIFAATTHIGASESLTGEPVETTNPSHAIIYETLPSAGEVPAYGRGVTGVARTRSHAGMERLGETAAHTYISRGFVTHGSAVSQQSIKHTTEDIARNGYVIKN